MPFDYRIDLSAFPNELINLKIIVLFERKYLYVRFLSKFCAVYVNHSVFLNLGIPISYQIYQYSKENPNTGGVG